MTKRKDYMAKPYQRSATTKKVEYELTVAENTAIPLVETEGFDCSEFLAVKLSVHPVDPLIGSITAGATVTLRVWRYLRAATNGTAVQGSGQWFCEADWTAPLDGDGSSGGMQKIYNVWDAERMYVQVVSVNDPGVQSIVFNVGAYQLGPDYADPETGFFESVSAAAAAATAPTSGTSDVNIAEVAGTATSVDAGASDAGTIRVIPASDSPGIGAHDAATAAAGLRALFVATSVDPADVADQDDVHPITDLRGALIVAGYNRTSELIRVQETDPINFWQAWDKIEESSMGTTGSPYEYYLSTNSYYRMSLQIDITAGSGTVTLTTLGTVENDDPDLTARNYVDQTTAWTGGATVTTSQIITDTNGFWGNFSAVKLNVAVVNASNDSAVRIDTKRFIGG